MYVGSWYLLLDTVSSKFLSQKISLHRRSLAEHYLEHSVAAAGGVDSLRGGGDEELGRRVVNVFFVDQQAFAHLASSLAANHLVDGGQILKQGYMAGQE